MNVPGRIGEEEAAASDRDEELMLRIAAQERMQENLNKMMPKDCTPKRKY